MIRETALLAISCVLFVSMGLSAAIQETLHFKSQILSCPKCLTFWSVLIFNLLTGTRPVEAVAVSFISAYVALWAALLLDSITIIYNWFYEKITEPQDTDKENGVAATTDNADGEAGASDEVS